MNRLSTAGFVPPSVYIGFRLFVLLGRRSGDVSSMLWRMRRRLFPRRTVLLANSPARPRPATPPCAPTRPARGMSGFWARQVRYELDCSCFRKDVQDSVLDLLEGKREGYLRAGSTQRRPVLPCPASPRCPAVRRPDPTGPWCVRVLDSTSLDHEHDRENILLEEGAARCWPAS